jgi:hypothetical protein
VVGILGVVVLVLVVVVAVVVIAVDRLAAFIFPHFPIIHGREQNPTHTTTIIKATVDVTAAPTAFPAENKKMVLFQVALAVYSSSRLHPYRPFLH